MTDTNSVQACLGVNCLSALPSNPFEAGWREGYCPECLDEIARDEIRAERQDARNEVERPTPITDGEWTGPFSYDLYEDGMSEVGMLTSAAHSQGAWVKIEDYRVLERQLAEARDNEAAMRRIASACQCPSKDADIAILKGQLAEAIKQRNAYRYVGQTKVTEMAHRIATVEQQRDTLAEALRDIKDRCSDSTIMLHPDADAKGCVDDCLEWSEAALATFDRKEHNGSRVNAQYGATQPMSTESTQDSAALPRMACCASLMVNTACRENSAENETQDCAPCPHCGSLKDPWFSRVLPMSYHCQDCGKDWDSIPENPLHNTQAQPPSVG